MSIADVSGNTIAELVSLKGRVAVVTGGAAGFGWRTGRCRPGGTVPRFGSRAMTGSTLKVDAGEMA